MLQTRGAPLVAIVFLLLRMDAIAQSSCQAFSNACASCTAAPTCGFCKVSGACMPGDVVGANDGSCTGSNWAYVSSLCGSELSYACSHISSCSSCVSFSACGYCSTSGLCVQGSASGGQCVSGWRYGVGSCPAVPSRSNTGLIASACASAGFVIIVVVVVIVARRRILRNRTARPSPPGVSAPPAEQRHVQAIPLLTYVPVMQVPVVQVQTFVPVVGYVPLAYAQQAALAQGYSPPLDYTTSAQNVTMAMSPMSGPAQERQTVQGIPIRPQDDPVVHTGRLSATTFASL